MPDLPEQAASGDAHSAQLELLQKTAAAWHESDPASEFYTIPDAGHCANMDNPQAFNAALLAFLTEVENQAGDKGM